MGVKTAQGDFARMKVMAFLKEYQKRYGYLPSLAEIGRGTDLPRTNVQWHLEKLRELGQVEFRDGHMSRSLRITE